MSFSWFIDKVAAFATAFEGKFWHDTLVMIIPPLSQPIDVTYVPSKDLKTLIIGLTFGDILIYEPDTNTYRRPTDNEIPLLKDAGIYHRSEPWMEWHWDPLVKSISSFGVYPQLGFTTVDRPYELRIVNRTPFFIYTDATFWLIKFPNEVYCPIYGEENVKCDVEFLFKKYMEGIVRLHVFYNKLIEELIKRPEDVIELMKVLFKKPSIKAGI